MITVQTGITVHTLHETEGAWRMNKESLRGKFKSCILSLLHTHTSRSLCKEGVIVHPNVGKGVSDTI